MTDPTYVLVHGGWGGAWAWRDLCSEFDRRDAKWRTLDLPSSHDLGPGLNDLEADVTAVVSATNAVEGPLVLVGHSYGGAVVSEAGERVANLIGEVYLAALVPHPGESATDASRTMRVRTELDDAMRVDGELLHLDPELAASALYGECSSETKEWAVARLGTQTISSFRAHRHSSDSGAPRRYVLCGNDRAIDPSLQLMMAERCDEFVEITSDHSPYLSHVEPCANALLTWPRRS